MARGHLLLIEYCEREARERVTETEIQRAEREREREKERERQERETYVISSPLFRSVFSDLSFLRSRPSSLPLPRV
jgi:hypothetical protein